MNTASLSVSKPSKGIDISLRSSLKTAPMAKLMKAAVVRAFGKPLKIEEVPIPAPGSGEALPKLAATAEDRRLVVESLQRVRAHQRRDLTGEQKRRLSRVEKLLGPPPARTTRRESVVATE